MVSFVFFLEDDHDVSVTSSNICTVLEDSLSRCSLWSHLFRQTEVEIIGLVLLPVNRSSTPEVVPHENQWNVVHTEGGHQVSSGYDEVVGTWGEEVLLSSKRRGRSLTLCDL